MLKINSRKISKFVLIARSFNAKTKYWFSGIDIIVLFEMDLRFMLPVECLLLKQLFHTFVEGAYCSS